MNICNEEKPWEPDIIYQNFVVLYDNGHIQNSNFTSNQVTATQPFNQMT